ncbi:MAG: DUF4143 domain-containing protein [Clostridia bacterium]|nr:DUF4143 domain-containing protein [Clostridia bacterium]
MEKKYINRLIEKELNRKLKSSGCVLVTGPKFCGKTTMCEQHAKSTVALKTTNSIQLAKAEPSAALIGEKPHLIDEWQKAPEIWNEIKNDLDKDYQFGKYIITGSTTPIDEKQIQHSGAGRISTLELRPFTLLESGESTGAVSLLSLSQGEKVPTIFAEDNKVSLVDIAHLICRGGWPIATLADKEYAIDVTRNYYQGLFRIEDESDDFAYFLKNKDINLLTNILKSYARNVSTQANKRNMIKDILKGGEREKLDEDTFNKYVDVLKKLFIIYDLPASNFNLRSSATVRVAPTHHFVDTSIALAALDILPEDLLNDLNSFGLFFEDMALRDLSVYASANHARIKHYRDSSGQEVDAIVEFDNGDFGLIEVKIASDENICEGIKSLNRFEAKLNEQQKEHLKFKMILTSHGACYHKDGVNVVPITMLKD